jgi:hypothetical protein
MLSDWHTPPYDRTIPVLRQYPNRPPVSSLTGDRRPSSLHATAFRRACDTAACSLLVPTTERDTRQTAAMHAASHRATTRLNWRDDCCAESFVGSRASLGIWLATPYGTPKRVRGYQCSAGTRTGVNYRHALARVILHDLSHECERFRTTHSDPFAAHDIRTGKCAPTCSLARSRYHHEYGP